MNYIYLPAGRSSWIEVAEILHDEVGWQPSIWLGDNRHLETAQRRFPACEVYDFWATNKGIDRSREPGRISTVPQSVIDNHSLDRLKSQVFKMMDRQDAQGRYRLLEREAVFYRLSTLFLDRIATRDPSALIASEAPHSPAQLILFGLCRMLDIPTLFFSSSNVVPVLFLKTGVESGFVRPKNLNIPDRIRESLLGAVDRYCSSLHGKYGQNREPHYMSQQRLRGERSRWGKSAISDLRVLAANVVRRRLERPSDSYQIDDSTQLSQLADAADPPGFVPARSLAEAIRAEWARLRFARGAWIRLEASHRRLAVSDVPSEPFVFFALHYEPERTTNPEGGHFYNQYDALLTLRSALPEDCHLVVREHPSQFNRSLRGFLGRSPLFYDVINQLPNTSLISHDYDRYDAMTRASITATVSGTVALEAACLGGKALVFGHPWFKGCPGVRNYQGPTDIESLLAMDAASLGEVRRFLMDLIDSYGIPGCINPSNEVVFGDFAEIINSPDSARWVASALKDGLIV